MTQAIILMLCAACAATVDVLAIMWADQKNNKLRIICAIVVTAIVAAEIGDYVL